MAVSGVVGRRRDAVAEEEELVRPQTPTKGEGPTCRHVASARCIGQHGDEQGSGAGRTFELWKGHGMEGEGERVAD